MKNLTLKDLRQLQARVTDRKLLVRIEWFVLAVLISQ